MEATVRKRKKSRWVFEWVLLLSVCTVLLAWQCHSRPVYIYLHSVAVSGNQKVETAELARMAGIPLQSGPVWFWDAKEFFSLLRDDIRIETYSAVYEWPATLTLMIRERKPLAIVGSPHGFLDVDATGTVTAISRNLKNMEAPIITGVRAGRMYPGQQVSEPQLGVALEYLNAMNRETRDRISEVHLTQNEGVTVIALNNVRIRLGPLDRVRDKARLTQDILQEINAKGLSVESVDLTHEKPVLRFRRQ